MILDDVCSLIVDTEHKTAPRQEEGFPSIRTPNIGRGRLELEGVYRVSEETYKLWTRRAIPQVDDLILAREAPVGNVAIIPEDLDVCLGQRTVLLRPDLEMVYPHFLCYYILSPKIQNRILSRSGGSTVSHLNMKDIRNLDIDELPPLQTQKRIASILSAYDDLIENNLKRIKLLEETAQNIYKEWFVNFRFPNYESTPINQETGLPEGWEVKKFSDCAEFMNGFAFKPHHHSIFGLPIIKIKELKNGITSETPRYNGEEVPKKYYISDNSIIFSWSADLNVYWWTNGESILNQHLFKVEPFEGINKEHFYFGLKSSIPEFLTRANGSTMKHIKRSELDTVFYTQPDNDTASMFAKCVKPVLSNLVILNNQIVKLKEARDILLPRLMNKTIEV